MTITETSSIEQMRDSAIYDFRNLVNGDLESNTSSTLGLTLEDIRVRDTVLHLMVMEKWDLDRCSIVMADLIDALDDSAPASLLTVASVVSWMAGDLPAAVDYLMKALVLDSKYNLAVLILGSLQLPVELWQETVSEMTYREVRYGYKDES
jgi:hypothetical protein